MYVEILAYSSSDWRSISQKKPLCKLTLNRDQSYWQRAKIICLLSLPMVFPYQPRFFFFLFFVFFIAPLTQFLEEGTPAREQVLISALAKSARPTRFESVIELREVCGEFVRVSSTKKISLSRTKSHCKGRISVKKL